MLSASEDGSARVWSLDSDAITQQACLSGHSAEVMRASWKPDELLIATGALCCATNPRFAMRTFLHLN